MGMTKEEALNNFFTGIDCSQIVFGYAADKIGLDADEARKIASAFGGGMWSGKTCGCVTGALMAIGYQYGHCKNADTETKDHMLAKKTEFEEKFSKAQGSLICKELLGHKIPEEMDAIMEENLFEVKCAPYAVCACEILEEIFAE